MMKPKVQGFKAGDYLFHEHDTSRELYIIQSGSVKVLRKVGAKDIELAVLKKGSVLGEMALIDGKPRSASAMACDECKSIMIDGDEFFSKIKGVPVWFMALIRMISLKIRNANDRLQRFHSQNLGINIVIMLGYLFDRYGAAVREGDCRKAIELNAAKSRLIRLLGVPEQRIDQMVGFLQQNHIIDINDNKLCQTDAAMFDHYNLFLRLLVRKILDNPPSVSEQTASIIEQAIRKNPEFLTPEDRRFEAPADELWALFTEPEHINQYRKILDELKAGGILDIQGDGAAQADAPNPLAGRRCFVHTLPLTKAYCAARFGDKVPSL